jgi:hypothetical protein
MHVRVKVKILPPGVQHGQSADLCTQVLGIGGPLEQRLGGGSEQEVIDNPGVRQRDRVEHVWEREDDMEVRHGKQIGCLRLEPPSRGGGLARRTMAIAARVVGNLAVPTTVTQEDMSAPRRRPAGDELL